MGGSQSSKFDQVEDCSPNSLQGFKAVLYDSKTGRRWTKPPGSFVSIDWKIGKPVTLPTDKEQIAICQWGLHYCIESPVDTLSYLQHHRGSACQHGKAEHVLSVHATQAKSPIYRHADDDASVSPAAHTKRVTHCMTLGEPLSGIFCYPSRLLGNACFQDGLLDSVYSLADFLQSYPQFIQPSQLSDAECSQYLLPSYVDHKNRASWYINGQPVADSKNPACMRVELESRDGSGILEIRVIHRDIIYPPWLLEDKLWPRIRVWAAENDSTQWIIRHFPKLWTRARSIPKRERERFLQHVWRAAAHPYGSLDHPLALRTIIKLARQTMSYSPIDTILALYRMLPDYFFSERLEWLKPVGNFPSYCALERLDDEDLVAVLEKSATHGRKVIDLMVPRSSDRPVPTWLERYRRLVIG